MGDRVRFMRRRVPAAVLLVFVLVPQIAAAANIWFAGGGLEFPRAGKGNLADWNRAGPTLVVGIEHGGSGTLGGFARLAWSAFPSNGASPQSLPPGLAVNAGTASLFTMAGGARLRRRDLGFSPYFDVGFGWGYSNPHRVLYSSGILGPGDSGGSWSWCWIWGTGVAFKPSERYGVFIDGHWDTVPEGSGPAWTTALRAGVERR